MDWKDILAVAAFALGLYNLWRANWWNRVGFYYLQTGTWTFVLVNTGRTDILVRDVRFWITGKDPSSGTGLPQESNVSSENPLMLRAGTACEVTGKILHEYLWADLHDQGIPTDEIRPNSREFRVKVQIDWIDMNAEMRSSEVMAGKVIRTPTQFLAWHPLVRKQNLLLKPTVRLGPPSHTAAVS